jgi:hypothetical protein
MPCNLHATGGLKNSNEIKELDRGVGKITCLGKHFAARSSSKSHRYQSMRILQNSLSNNAHTMPGIEAH